MRRRVTAGALVFLCTVSAALLGSRPLVPSCQLEGADAEAAAWLGERARPLASVEPGVGSDDLAWLKEALQGVRVVALGEATHGSREFSTIKHRLVEFLVTEMGFTALAFEADLGTIAAVDRHLQGEEGMAVKALRSLPPVWQTVEVHEMFTWLREHNASLPVEERVQVSGLDVQSAIVGGQLLQGYLTKVDRSYANEVSGLIRQVIGADPNAMRPRLEVTAHEKADTLEQLRELVNHLEMNEVAYSERSSFEETHRAIVIVRNLVRFYELQGGPQSVERSVNEVRDPLMAETVLEQLAELGPNGKLVIWAHNFHIAAIPGMMGDHLRQALGDEYYALGFSFGEGGFRARPTDELASRVGPMQDYWVGEPMPGSVDYLFRCTELEAGIVDLRDASGEWFEAVWPMRFFGWGVFNDNLDNYALTRFADFDALIYLPEVTPAVPFGGRGFVELGLVDPNP